ncbi:MAG: hypothetical protein KC619_19325 [Myxococcales bacterium]|nr:hypothetical protein [Myxococcales bacterium]
MTAPSTIVRTLLTGSAVWLVLAGTAAAQVLVPATPGEAGAPRLPMLSDNMETARSMAMGLGARASATSTSAVLYNPAGMSIGRHYHVESSMVYEPQESRFAAGGVLSDSYSGPVNMGVAFRYIQGNGTDGHGGYDGRISLAVPFGDNFAIGASGRYVSFWREGQEDAPPFAEQVNLDAAIRVTPIPGLHIAALGYNLIDVGSPLVPVQVGGSISYTIDNTFTLAFDGLADLSTWHYPDGTIHPEAMFGGAAEFFTGEVPIRAGWMFDTGRSLHYVTAGAGWMNGELGVDVAVRQQVTGPDLDTWLLASFRYFVH